MSTHQEKLKKSISIIRKLISLYQELLNRMNSKSIPVVCHHSGTSQTRTTLEAINNNHKWRGYPKSQLGYYIAYNFVIINGVVTKTRKLTEKGQATSTFKKFHWDIMVVGSFDIDEVSQENRDALEKLLMNLRLNHSMGSFLPHNQYYNTICCGENLIKELDRMKMTNNVL